MFRAVEPYNLYHKVVDQIEEAILSEQLKAGDRLPSERKLTEVFNISRRTLREAMRILEQKGLIEIKTGSKGGAYVTDRSSDRMKDSLLILIRKKKIPYDRLVEFRIEIEGDIASLAAERSTREDLAILEGLLAETIKLAERGLSVVEQFNRQETALHLQLGLICGNPLYEVILKIIHEVLVSPSFELLEVDESYLTEARIDWIDIVTAIRTRQAPRARSLMRTHLEKFRRYHRANGEVFDGGGWQITGEGRTGTAVRHTAQVQTSPGIESAEGPGVSPEVDELKSTNGDKLVEGN